MSVPKVDLDADVARLEALRASEACLRGVFSAMAEGLIIYDSAGRVVEANRSAERILGLSREQIFDPALREPGWRLVREDGTDLPRQEQLGMITLRTGVPGSNHVAGVRLPGGALRRIRLNSQPVTLGSARKPDFVVLSFDDITEALSMTAELRRARADFEAILHNVPAHITSWRRDRTLRFANRAALEHFGLEAGRVQDMLTPIQHRLGAGCHLNRRTAESIGAAGLAIVELEQRRLPLIPLIIGVARLGV